VGIHPLVFQSPPTYPLAALGRPSDPSRGGPPGSPRPDPPRAPPSAAALDPCRAYRRPGIGAAPPVRPRPGAGRAGAGRGSTRRPEGLDDEPRGRVGRGRRGDPPRGRPARATPGRAVRLRLGRIRALKKASGRGKHASWVIPHEELLRFQREGLLPDRRRQPKTASTT
jgi:hypothetical protein